MDIREVTAEQVNQDRTPLLYLGITPMQDRIGQPTSTLFVTPRMTVGGLYHGETPDNTSVDALVDQLAEIIDGSSNAFADGQDLRVYTDPVCEEGLWEPVIEGLRQHYQD